MRLLVIEDENRLADLIARVLRQEHYDVDIARTGTDGDDLALTASYDLAIVDRRLPGMDGLSIVRHMRAEHVDTPVLMLTALGDVPDRVDGLHAGADDYMGKPFAFDELLARIEALLRRRDRPIADTTVGASGIVLDRQELTVRCGDNSVTLTPREFALLELLVRHRGQTVTRDQILENVWGYDADPAGNVVELYIHYLRRKLAQLGAAHRDLIGTVRGVGYRISEDHLDGEPCPQR